MADQLQELIYHVSHDLAAPIRQVNSFARLLQESEKEDVKEGVDTDQSKYLNYVVTQSQLAQDMLSALLELTRTNADQTNVTAMNLEEVVRAVTLGFEAVEFHIDIDTDTLIGVDPHLFARMMEALVQNVVDHVSTPEMWLHATTGDHMVTLHMRDNGPGLTEAEWQNYVVPFGRAKGHPDASGLGMGLTMACRIADVHGTQLQYQPTENGFGCSIEFTQLCE